MVRVIPYLYKLGFCQMVLLTFSIETKKPKALSLLRKILNHLPKNSMLLTQLLFYYNSIRNILQMKHDKTTPTGGRDFEFPMWCPSVAWCVQWECGQAGP